MTHQSNSPQNYAYQIRVEGHLSPQRANWFGNATVTLEDYGSTLITSPHIDQAALHGLLKKIRDFGIPLISVNRLPSNQ